MRQKLTQEILGDVKQAVSPIQSKKEALFHVHRENSRKAWRSRKKCLAVLRAAETAKEQDEGKEAA